MYVRVLTPTLTAPARPVLTVTVTVSLNESHSITTSLTIDVCLSVAADWLRDV